MPNLNSPLPPVLLLDGGLGTTLADHHNCVFDHSTPLWSSHLLLTPSGRETLSNVQTAFAIAGADVILTSTYQASYEGFKRSGIDEQEAGKCMRGAVEISRKALESKYEKGKASQHGVRMGGKVALGLGAYGATMLPGAEYSGEYDDEHVGVQQLRDWHLNRISAFVPDSKDIGEEGNEKAKCWEDVDMVAFETLPRLDEILAVREVMAAVDPREAKSFWISCVFPGDGNALPDGSSIKEVVAAMLGKRENATRPWGVGINCTKVGKVEGLLVEFENATKELLEAEGKNSRKDNEGWPALVVYPDGTNGEVYNTATKVWEKRENAHTSGAGWDETIYGIVSRVRERKLWKKILVGGCCKTTPDDIRKLRVRIDPDSDNSQP